MKNSFAIILAGGDGTRMKSNKPKVMAEVLFKPMIDWVIGSVKDADIDDICVVTGYRHEVLEAHLDGRTATAYQSERLGTGHAVMQARKFLEGQQNADVLVLAGDAPFLDTDTIRQSHEFHVSSGNAVTVISAVIDAPKGYGRIVRDVDDTLLKIVEDRDASAEEKAIKEVNSGAYWFDVPSLLDALDRLEAFVAEHPNNAQEYYLTDAIEILKSLEKKVAAFSAESPDIVLGANTRKQLADLNEIARTAILEQLMDDGVAIPFPATVIVGPDARVGRDTQLLPGTMLLGETIIGENCVIGPNTMLTDCKVYDGASVKATDGVEATIGKRAQVGPFTRLRPNAVIGDDVRLGNFVEIKNANIGSNTKVSHLTYVGDADLGRGINIGCGCATVNYSGKVKSRTVIEDGAFIGCDTSLVAPVKVGERAYIAAGSTITEDVPADALALARSRQVIKKDWVSKNSPYKK